MSQEKKCLFLVAMNRRSTIWIKKNPILGNCPSGKFSPDNCSTDNCLLDECPPNNCLRKSCSWGNFFEENCPANKYPLEYCSPNNSPLIIAFRTTVPEVNCPQVKLSLTKLSHRTSFPNKITPKENSPRKYLPPLKKVPLNKY